MKRAHVENGCLHKKMSSSLSVIISILWEMSLFFFSLQCLLIISQLMSEGIASVSCIQCLHEGKL